MRFSFQKISLIVLAVFLSTTCSKFLPNSKEPTQKRDLPANPDKPLDNNQVKLVWLALDGLNVEALTPWVAKMKTHQPKGLKWVLNEARGRKDLKVIAPTITAPSHISTITCTGAGEHGILDNTSWTGTGNTSGFNRPYSQENWIARLRKHGLRVGSALYPSIDGLSEERSADIGIVYDNPGSADQILKVTKGSQLKGVIPDRAEAGKTIPFEINLSSDGVTTAKTPFGEVGPLKESVPADVMLDSMLNGKHRRAAISFMIVSSSPDAITVAVSPVQIMPTMGDEFTATLDRKNIFFSSLKDYKFQNQTNSYLASLSHKRKLVADAQIEMLSANIDVAFLYFEDLDSLLHAYFHDEKNEAAAIEYLTQFDQDLSRVIASVPPTSDLVILGDHGMSAIGYVLNARKILTDEVASKGLVMTGGGALYFYPPQGDMTQDPPTSIDLESIAQDLRSMSFEITGKKMFAKVLVRGSKEAEAEGLAGKNVPWIMAFANDGVAFKNSVEDKLLLARATWAPIPAGLASKYPEPMNNGKLQVPVPAGQHGHWNELPEMRTRLVLEGPHVSKLNAESIVKTLDLVPVVADSLNWPRPAGCSKP